MTKPTPFLLLVFLAGAALVASTSSASEAPWTDPQLVEALISVESNHNPDAVGDGGLAVGLLQIHPIMVRDVNRIANTQYTLEDRRDPVKCREMFYIYSRHYAQRRNDWSREGIARRWNGGPDGHRQDATRVYWDRVRQRLE